MRSDEVRRIVKGQPFEAIRVCLSDGRAVIIRHPDQAVVTDRHVFVGLATIERSFGTMSTPRDGDKIAKDWMLISLVHSSSIEPVKSSSNGRKRRT